jgi:hypothetical protein
MGYPTAAIAAAFHRCDLDIGEAGAATAAGAVPALGLVICAIIAVL